MDFLISLFNQLQRALSTFISPPQAQDAVSFQQSFIFDTAHEEIFGADGSPIFGEIIGRGSTGWVFRISKDKVLKVPRFHRNFADKDPKTQISYENDNDMFLQSQRREREAYKRLGQFHGILPAKLTDAGIELPYMRNGTVEEYLDTHEIDLDTRLRWIKTITSVVHRAHEKRLLITDFGLRNFLLDDNLSLAMIDFGNSIIVSDDTEFGEYVYHAYSEKCDIAAVGSLIYEIMTGKYYMVHVNVTAPFNITESTSRLDGVNMWFPYWPSKEELADTRDVSLFGDIILNCWLKNGFQTMDQVCEAVAQVVD
ncbi:hypothetical protein EMCG_02733 [[Emmonsia] crescens]|uniref:Protein kinase domain-containing protein n=1 Tax=[Emmonsia] crescens TaxID=73230 RepID=A0A0G2HXS8_9EURO|nr:hypothetical protein EMCG_02733 [Emmonsia crescens UAMH 3008]